MRRRVEVFIGPFGSGKTEVALNRSLLLAAQGAAVTLIDLDIVDPFFRARQVREVLAQAGVSLVAPEGEWAEADLPLVIPRVFEALQRPGCILLDVGGEAQGALVLRQVRALLPEDAEVFLVVNPYRPAMGTALRIAEMGQALEAAGNVTVTALVSVPHLGDETGADVVRQGHAVVCAAAALLGVPVRWLAVREPLPESLPSGTEILPLRLYMRPPWEEPEWTAPAQTSRLGGGQRGQDRH
jgi:RecA/RadA recombinase